MLLPLHKHFLVQPTNMIAGCSSTFSSFSLEWYCMVETSKLIYGEIRLLKGSWRYFLWRVVKDIPWISLILSYFNSHCCGHVPLQGSPLRRSSLLQQRCAFRVLLRHNCKCALKNPKVQRLKGIKSLKSPRQT